MKYPGVVALFLCLSVGIKAQQQSVTVNFELEKENGVDSLMIQSIVTGKVFKISIDNNQQLALFPPVDIVLIMAEGKKTYPPAFNVLVEDSLSVGLNPLGELTYDSPGEDRRTEYLRFQQLSPVEKHSSIFPLLAKNVESITQKDYLDDYVRGGYGTDSLSEEILKLMSENPNPATEHHFIKSLLAALNPKKVDRFILPDTLRRITAASPENDEEAEPTNLLVLDFWYINCRPCLRDHAQMKKDLSAGVFPEGVTVVGVSIDPSERDWEDFVHEQELPWDNVFLGASRMQIIEYLGIIAYPTYLLLEGDGTVRGRFSSYRKLRGRLEE